MYVYVIVNIISVTIKNFSCKKKDDFSCLALQISNRTTLFT